MTGFFHLGVYERQGQTTLILQDAGLANALALALLSTKTPLRVDYLAPVHIGELLKHVVNGQVLLKLFFKKY